MHRSVGKALQRSPDLLAGLQTFTAPALRVLTVQDFGGELVGYEQGLRLQQLLAEQRLAGHIDDTLLQLQVSAVV